MYWSKGLAGCHGDICFHWTFILCCNSEPSGETERNHAVFQVFMLSVWKHVGTLSQSSWYKMWDLTDLLHPPSLRVYVEKCFSACVWIMTLISSQFFLCPKWWRWISSRFKHDAHVDAYMQMVHAFPPAHRGGRFLPVSDGHFYQDVNVDFKQSINFT